MPPPRPIEPPKLCSAIAYRSTRTQVGLARSCQLDRCRADHQPLPLVALEPDIDLHRSGDLVLLRHGAAEADRPAGEDQPAKCRSEPPEAAGTGPAVDQGPQQPHAHVARRDHARQALLPGALVVGEAREVNIARARVSAHLVLGQEARHRPELVALQDVIEAAVWRHASLLPGTSFGCRWSPPSRRARWRA